MILKCSRLILRSFENHHFTSVYRHATIAPNYIKQCNLTTFVKLRPYSSGSASNIVVVDYNFVKNISKHPEKLFIDVREPDELKETGQIPGSINIPLGLVTQELGPGLSAREFKEKYGREKPQPNTEIIFHCKAGIRSLKAAEATAGLGYKDVKNYEGSWLDWAEREGLIK